MPDILHCYIDPPDMDKENKRDDHMKSGQPDMLSMMSVYHKMSISHLDMADILHCYIDPPDMDRVDRSVHYTRSGQPDSCCIQSLLILNRSLRCILNTRSGYHRNLYIDPRDMTDILHCYIDPPGS